MNLEALPGEEIVLKGLQDLDRGLESTESLLVSMAPSRLREVGVQVPPNVASEPELKLFRLLETQHGEGAHSKYNAWRRRLSSFSQHLGVELKHCYRRLKRLGIQVKAERARRRTR